MTTEPGPDETVTAPLRISATGDASASGDSIAVSGGVTGGIHGPTTWLQQIGVFLPGSLRSRKTALVIVCLLALLLGGVALGAMTGTPPFGGADSDSGSGSDRAGEAPEDGGGTDASGAAAGGGTGDAGSGPAPTGGPEDDAPEDDASGGGGTEDGGGGTTTEAFHLSAPTLLTPGNDAVLDAYPRAITFTWQGVTGATDYRVEVECRCDGDWSSQVDEVTAATSHDTTWPDATEGRWRVTARTADDTSASDWWYFRYSLTLPAPVQVYPAHGSVFTHYPRTMTLDWDATPGAAGYYVEIDYYAFEQWNTLVQETTPDTGYTFDFIGAQPGRWRVTATTTDGALGASSDWWEFTYTQ
ncbi:hypothetical protein [Streptomyces sp. URMC 129]|uniref:hypothetical protein n=1 Tax=Streptomyces sp. URMC 129 TaxID=3423407 RepID=UPI003F1AA2D6